MKEQNEIDQLFEEQLGNLSVEPTADSWGAITSSLDAAGAGTTSVSSGKGRLFLYALIGTVAAILAYVLFFNQGKSRNITPKVHPVVELKKKSLQKPQKIQSEDALETQSYTSKQTDNTSQQAKNNHQLVQPSNEQTVDAIVEPIDLSQNKTERESNQPRKTKTNIQKAPVAYKQELLVKGEKEELAKVEVSEVQEVNVQEVAVGEVVFTETQKKTTKEIPEIETTTENKAVSIEEIAVVAESKEQINEQNNSNPNNVEAETQEAVSTEEVAVASIESINKENAEDVDASPSSPSVPGTAGIHKSTGWSIDGFVGPAMILSNENHSPNEGEAIYQAGIEPQIITPNIGLNVKYHINNWFIQSGVGYSEYGENRKFMQDIEMHDTSGFSKQNIDQYYSYDTTGWVKDPSNSGVLIPVFDAIHHSDTTYNWVTTDSMYYEHLEIYAQNRFRYIEIPAMVGYEFRFKNFGIELATGVSIGFRVNSSGKFLDSKNKLVDINPSNSPYTNTMMNYILTVGVKYHLSNRFSVIAQPIYKTNLNSIIKSGFGSDVRYTSVGLNVGVNYIIK
jgi:hypothetical protein